MTVPTATVREDLLELAALDVIGQLDEYEQSLFTRSLHDAPESVQREIIDFQAALASDETLLPDIAPPRELRQRVLDSVNFAIEQDAHRLAPIATIGRGRRLGEALVDDDERSGFTSATMNFWRVASFVLAGSLIIALYFFADAYQHGKTVSEYALTGQTEGQLETMIGSSFREFVGNPNCTVIALTHEDDAFGGHAVLYINESSREVFLLALGMPDSDEHYTLHVTTADGERHALRGFEAKGGVHGTRLEDVSAAMIASVSWDITNAAGAVILSGRQA